MDRRTILAIALPILLSNVSTPLLGLVDTAVVGRLPDPAYIGAVAVGALIFTFLFWGFGFLRMATTGLTAQALGASDSLEIRASLGRSLLLAVGLGILLIALQEPIAAAAFALLEGSDQVESLARGYFQVRIWSAPAALVNYALLGWFIGLARSKRALVLQLVLNVCNMLLDLLFVVGLGWNVKGVACGTLLAEWIAAALGLAVAAHALRGFGGSWRQAALFDVARLRRMLSVNRDIMIRTLALLAVFAWFMAQGAKAGDVVLAANSILMQFIGVAAFFLDALAFAAETLVGQAVGAARREGLQAAARGTTEIAAALACGATLLFFVLGPLSIDLLTVDAAARAAARQYLPWAVAAPLAGVWCFQLDGIFIGATRTREMRNAMLEALAIFALAWWLLARFGNHGLWAAFYVHYAARTGTLLARYPRLVRSLPRQATSHADGAREQE
jgi:MATE family multidrug resistance protein